MKKNNTWNIRCLVDDSFVPSSKRPGVLYCKLTYFYSFCGFLPTSFLVHVVIECPLTVWLLGSPYTHFWHENWALLTSQTFQKPMKACTQKVLCCCLWAKKKLCPFQSWPIKHSNISKNRAIASLFCFILGLGPKGPSHIPSIRRNPRVAPKGQIISKADWRAIDSPKERMDEFVQFAFLLFAANKSNSSILFLGETTTRQSAFRFHLTFNDRMSYL